VKFRTDANHRQSLLTIAGYLLPCLVLFAVHYNALRTWFFMDDFAWLGLRLEYFVPRDLLPILFEPRAQGTVRVLSERLFFLGFSSLFGMKAGPFHYFVFATQCGSLLFASAIVRRISGSQLAGVAAATLWALSHATSVPLSWLSAYNEILCGFCMLAAFYCLIRFVESGERRFWILQWAAYLTGFLVLEVTVVYPAVACFYLWLAARQYLRKALWLWIPSFAFVALHFLLIPKAQDTVYKMTFDTGIVVNLALYAFKAVGPSDLTQFMQDMPAPIGVWVAAGAAVLLGVFLCIRLIRKRDLLPLIGVAWFVLFLAPILPLQNHFSEYYITIASFGFAMLGGWAFESAVRSGWTLRLIAIAAAGVFAWGEVAEAQAMEGWYRTHSGQMHTLLNGVDEISHRRHVRAVMLAGIDDELYISGFLDDPFRLYGIDRAYLLPGSESSIRSVPRSQIRMRTDQDTADALMADGQTIVAAFDGRGLVDVTDTYRAMRAGRQKVTIVRTSDPIGSSRLGPEWNAVESEYRWMPRKATVKLDPPSKQPARLYVTVYCPRTILDAAGGKLELSASIGGKAMGTRPVVEGDQQLEFDLLSPAMFEQKQLQIVLEISHVVVPPADGRELGIPVLEIALKTP
jgi:hypothetical protein